METGDTGNIVTSSAELTLQLKALTLEQPNERELKNEARWIYCWNLWTELVRQQIEFVFACCGVQNDVRLPVRDETVESKEVLLAELQSHIITEPAKTLSRVKAIRRIKEISVKIKVWEMVRREAVNYLSAVQILSCEYLAGERELADGVVRALDIWKNKFLEKIMTASKNIDCHYKNMGEAIRALKKFRCHRFIIDPAVSKAIENYEKRPAQVVELEDGGRLAAKASRGEDSSENCSETSDDVPNEIPDFFQAVFAGIKPKRKTLGDMSDSVPLRESVDHYLRLIQKGVEWYLSWCEFTENVLKEIKDVAPSLGSEVITVMTQHINRQIMLLKGLTAEVQSLAAKLRLCEFESAQHQMSAIFTCLSAFDDFVSLIESLKHEASYLIRYCEIALINLGVLDLSREPKKLQPLRLYWTRNIISTKDAHLLASIDYLYQEMGNLIEFIEFRFHQEQGYLEKFGQMSADLLKKYTVHRMEVIQNQEFEKLEIAKGKDLAKELKAVSSPSGSATSSSPLSRYQRAEDLRRWVAESQKVMKDPEVLSVEGFGDEGRKLLSVIGSNVGK